MNETLLNLILDALVCHALTPERLVMEHMLLIAVLHANVGTEVGKEFYCYNNFVGPLFNVFLVPNSNFYSNFLSFLRSPFPAIHDEEI